MTDIERLALAMGWRYEPHANGYYKNTELMCSRVSPKLTGDGTVAVLEWLMREHDAEVMFLRNEWFVVNLVYGNPHSAHTLPAATLAAALEIIKDTT